jgi:hypothetical protein
MNTVAPPPLPLTPYVRGPALISAAGRGCAMAGRALCSRRERRTMNSLSKNASLCSERQSWTGVFVKMLPLNAPIDQAGRCFPCGSEAVVLCHWGQAS